MKNIKKTVILTSIILIILLALNLSNAATQVGCSQTSNPAPIVTIKPLQGEKAFNITINYPCTADFINLSRCQGNKCTSFSYNEQFPSVESFVDNDALLEWNKDYTYKIAPYYTHSGMFGDESIVVGNLGDIECWKQAVGNNFCVNMIYYENFKDYLQTYGYGSSSGADFQRDFTNYVDFEFTPRLNQAWNCNSNNILSNVVDCNKNPNQACIADETGTKCRDRTDCNFVNIFGLYTTKDSCEDNGENYCFFDKATSVVDKCYSCQPEMDCVDYKTKNSCERDNCNAGRCKWNDIFPTLGVGACVDTTPSKENCKFCDKNGTGAVGNQQAFNKVFDSCSESRAGALSTLSKPCVYNVQFQKAEGCDKANCQTLGINNCGTINPVINTADNSLLTKGNDKCSLGICLSSITCAKDADGDNANDCTTYSCEQDVYAPETRNILTTHQGIAEIIDLKIWDRINPDDKGSYQSSPDYKTRFCLVTPTQACDNTNNYPYETTNRKLIVSNLELKDFVTGTKYADLQLGVNTLKAYSIDPSKNREVVKQITFSACNGCSGPILTNLAITDSNLVNGVYYTSNTKPTINVRFDVGAEIINPRLISSTGTITLTSSKTGLSIDNSFTITQNLAESSYTLVADAKNSNGVSMRAPINQQLVVDATPPRVTINPIKNQIIKSSDVTLQLVFSEEININNNSIILAEEFYPTLYTKQLNNKDISFKLQKTANTYTYNANLTEGKKIIFIDAQDNAGNKLNLQSEFFIHLDGEPLKLVLTKPIFGATALNKFDITLETSANATCQYEFDKIPPLTGPAPSSPKTVDNFIEHNIFGFEIKDLRPHKLQVFCKKADCSSNCSNSEMFDLRVDKTKPSILSAYALPDVVAEQESNGDFLTTLRLQTDKLTSCKFDDTTQDINSMTNEFPDYNLIPRTVHLAELRVPAEKDYTYFVSCISSAGMAVDKASTIKFKVDLNAPLKIYDVTQKVFSSKTIELKVQTNKKAKCKYFGEKNGQRATTESWFTDAQGNTIESRDLRQTVDATNLLGLGIDAGDVSYRVKCSYNNFITGNIEESDVLIKTTIDTTPPTMINVDATSPLGILKSYDLDRLQVSLLAEDKESGISHYYYKVRTAGLGNILVDWAKSEIQDGTKFFITTDHRGKPLSLVDGSEYIIDAKAVNKAGIEGLETSSDIVEIDVSLAPPQCQNKRWDWDKGELDEDCGGVCGACNEGQNCNADNDCKSDKCDKKINKCIELCGLQDCRIGEECRRNDHCESNKCENKLCVENPCSNGLIDGSETDIDCGGSCQKCTENANCVINTDCDQGLLCEKLKCIRVKDDLDSDGVPDKIDTCPKTPKGEILDKKGSADSQKYTQGDEK